MILTTIASIIVKIVKLILNFIILILYRVGFAGAFLGIGGTWNLYEEKNSDVEIIASGVFVGYFVYTLVSLISMFFASSENKRTGSDGTFLGVGGTWNMAENKNADAEIFASGVFGGYVLYTFMSLIALCFAAGDHKTTFTDILMNVFGIFLWIAVGATALHYWHGYLSEHKYTHVNSERQVGLALGSLCVLNGAAYLIDSVLSVIFLIKAKMQ